MLLKFENIVGRSINKCPPQLNSRRANSKRITSLAIAAENWRIGEANSHKNKLQLSPNYMEYKTAAESTDIFANNSPR